MHASARSALLAALALSACSRADVAHTPHPQTLTATLAQEPSSLNPLLGLNDYENFITRMVFDRLVTVDPSGRTLLPRLAREVPTTQNGGVSADGKTIVWHLRPGVKWQDGAPFTSADVKYTFDAIADPANNVSNRRGFDLVRNVETPDALTVVAHLKTAFAPAITWFFGDGSNYAILPAHLLKGHELNRDAFNASPIGTGPFRVTKWLRGQQIELEPYDGYYGGKPILRKIVVRFVPDEATALDQLRTHESDLFPLASAAAYRQLRTIPGVRVSLTDTHAASVVVMNTTHGALRDARVRRAIVLAIDKNAIASKVAAGAAKPATEDLPDFMWAYDRALAPSRYDPAAARALLRAAGYVAQSDGTFAKDGKKLELVMAFGVTNGAARAAAVIVQSYLRDAGIALTVKGYNGSQIFAPMAAGGIFQTGNFDLAWYTMTLGIDPDTSSRFTCASIPPAGQNYSRYCNAEMDEAERQGLVSPEQSVRTAAYARTQTLLQRDAPLDFVFWPKNVDTADARLKGFAPNPVIASWNAERWSF